MAKDFAVVKIGGSQYKVSPKDNIQVEKLEAMEGDKLSFDDVLLTCKKGKISIGTPTVKGAKVEAKVLEQARGRKMKILKYKAKARYRKHIGHRQHYTRIEILKI